MPISGQDMHLRSYLKVIDKRRRVAGLFFVTVMTATLVWTFTATPQYEGTTKVLLERGESGDLTGRLRASSYDPEFYETQFQLIRSRAVARRVVDMFAQDEEGKRALASLAGSSSALDTLRDWAGRLAAKVRAPFANRAVSAEAGDGSREDRLAGYLSRGVRVRPMEGSRLVNISYLSPDPQTAAWVANATARAFMEETLNMKMESSRRTLEWMTRKAATERAKLEKAEIALQEYRQANNLVTLEDRVTVTPEKLSEISTQLVRAEARRKELEALYHKVERVARDPGAAETVTAIASDPAVRSLRAQIVETEKSIMELSGKYGPRHPAMLKAMGDLKILEEKRTQEIRRLVQSIRNDYELALANENSLRGQLDRTRSEALGFNEKFIRYGALKREVDTSRQLYDALMLKLKEQSITEETSPVNLWIVEEAQPPRRPARPQKRMNIVLGLALGVLGGVGVALFLEYLDNKVKDPEEVEAVLSTPVLGVVPRCRDKGQQIEGIVLREPLSSFSENYKSLRTALMLSAADTPPRRILVTSAIMGEGKTATAINLALTLAQTDKRVVLLDADMRKPRLHQLFRLSNDAGLSTYLTGANPAGILRKGPLANLTVITSGPVPPNPAELLSSDRMPALLNFLGDQFDVIISDSPPAMVVADARILGRIFDGTILVVQTGQTPYEIAGSALKTLRDHRARVLGLVVNGYDPGRGEYYYQEYHSYRGRVPATATDLRRVAGKQVG